MIKGFDPTLNGLPIFRKGDNVYILNNLPSIEQMQRDTLNLERMAHRFYEYGCPFSILEEFEKWWAWHYRTRALGESTGRVTCDMISDLGWLKANKKEPRMEFRVRSNAWMY